MSVVVVKQFGPTLEGMGSYGFAGPIDSAMAAYNKLKKANLISTKNPDYEKIIKRMIAAGELLGGVRQAIWAARQRGKNTEKSFAKFEQARGKLNQTMREVQEHVKAKSGRHLKMPYVNPIGSGPNVNFAGYAPGAAGFGQIATLIAAVKGIGKIVTLPATMIKKILSNVQGAEGAANQAAKDLIEEVKNDPTLRPEEKAEKIGTIVEELAPPEPEEEKVGFFDKIRQKVEDATGITAAKETTKKLVWYGGIAAILAATWYIYRKTQGKPFIPAMPKALSGGYGGFGMEQKNKMSTCATSWNQAKRGGTDKTHREFMSDCLKGKASDMMGGFGGMMSDDEFGSMPATSRKAKKGKKRGRKGKVPAAFAAQGEKMKQCAIDWRAKGKPGSWQGFIKKTECLK